MTKKQVTKKKPIKVQLSKEDLVELLTVLKNFIIDEEIFTNFKTDVHHRMDCLDRRIRELEISARHSKKSPCDYCRVADKITAVVYSKVTSRILTVNFKCSRCGQDLPKSVWMLSRKEKRALRILGAKI